MPTIKHRFSGATLYEREADNLRAAVIQATKKGADLEGADLKGADLTGAYLKGAYLKGADLTGAYLKGADLTGAYLTGAYLKGADLTGAYLTGADLTGAYLKGADLTGADLTGAYLDALTAARLSITPAGDLIGWKKCRGGVVAELLIPADAPRSNATGRKCRAEYVVTRALHGLPEGADHAVSLRGASTVYRVGETTRCHEWDACRWNECSGGIHFFLTREEAEDWTGRAPSPRRPRGAGAGPRRRGER